VSVRLFQEIDFMAHSASFHRASVRIARALAVGIASCSLFLAGCDSASSKSDKTVTEQLDDGRVGHRSLVRPHRD
jgi:hypothetical protein